MACETSVVAVEVGTALDYVRGRNTGYCAKLRDAEDYARGIEKLFRLSEHDYLAMRKECRKISEELSSPAKELEMYDKIFDKYL